MVDRTGAQGGAEGMKTSPQGAAFLASHEGLVPGPYQDSQGHWTYGIGHTAAAGAPDPSTLPRGMPDDLDAAVDRALRLFAADLAAYEAAVAAAIRAPVTQQQFDAAVSFHFNTGAIERATWVKTLNRGNVTLAAQQMMNWTANPELVKRRDAERRLFLHGEYGDGATTIWGVTEAGRVVWRSHGTIAPELVASYVRQPAPPVAQAPLTLIGRVNLWPFLAALAGIVGALVYGRVERGKGRADERQKHAADAAQAERDAHDRINRAETGVGASDADRIAELQRIAAEWDRS